MNGCLRLVVGSLVIAGAISACGSTEGASRPAGAGDGNTDARESVDAGGPLSKPLSCPGEGVANRPLPAESIFDALRKAAGYDFLERRPIAASDPEASPYPLLSLGTPCERAADVSACTSGLAGLSSNHEVLFPYDVGTSIGGPKGFYLVYSKGDTVGKISNLGELKTALPTVDSAVAALMYAEAASYRVECTREWLRQEADGFVVLASNGSACQRNRIVLFIRPDGTIEERDKVSYEAPCF